MRLRLLVLVLVMAPVSVRAEAVSARVINASQSPQPPCQCRAFSKMWHVGEEICLDLGQGRLAYTCGMDQNVTSWKATGGRCPES